MTRLLSPSLLALLSLVACSSSSTPTPSTPATPATPAPAGSGPVAEPGWTPVDPRIVRCGIDDRPRNVVSALPPPDQRPLLAEAVATRPADDAAAPRRRAPAVKPAPPNDLFEPDPGLDDLDIDPLPLTSPSGAPVPASLSSVDPHYEVCASLAAETEPLGPVTFRLELASNGSPLRVLPPAGSATPTPLVRCLMERACQLQATATPPGQKTTLGVPLRLHRNGQTVVQPPPPPAPAVRVDVATVTPRPDRDALQLQLRGAAGAAMRSCGIAPGRARVRLSLELFAPSSPRSPRRPRRLVVFVERHNLLVRNPRTEALEGTVPAAVLGCVVNAVSQQSFADRRAVAGTSLLEQLILTWNP